MSDDQTQKPKFEPPPWEQEAFERFRAAQEEQRKQDELDAALLEVRARQAESTAAESAADGSLPEARAAAPASGGAPSGQAVTAAGEGTTAAPVISDARIDSMLIQLKGEEPPHVKTNMALINSVIAGLGLAGLWIIIEAARLFSKTRVEGAGGMLGAVASLVVLLVGVGFVAGGFLLFRKYHV